MYFFFKNFFQIIYIKLFVITKFFFTLKKYSKDKFYLNYYFKFFNLKKWIENHQIYNNLKIKKKIIFFDIGAHIGLVQLLLKKKLKKSKIFAFEPNNVNFTFLKLHLKKNLITNCKAFNLAVSNKIGYANFEQSKTVSSISMMKKDGSYKVKTITLDQFEKKNIIPDIIKIDVEGHELNVLRGGQKMLKNHNIVLILSIHPKLNGSLIKLKNLLLKLQYTIKKTDLNKFSKMKNFEIVLYKKNHA